MALWKYKWKNSFFGSIWNRIQSLPEGAAFVTSDFSDVAESDTTSRSLLRLEKDGKIRRLLRGVYTRRSDREATPFEVARAIARGNGWHLAPAGPTALYIAGLTAEPPEVWEFITDGTYRMYDYGSVKLRFTRTTGGFLLAASETTALVVQVLKAYGKQNLNDEVLARLAHTLCLGHEEAILAESRHLAAWVKKALHRMCRTAAPAS